MASAEPVAGLDGRRRDRPSAIARSERNVEGMGRYGIETSNALGVSQQRSLRPPRKLKRNHERAPTSGRPASAKRGCSRCFRTNRRR
jgi:hypothetical protein